MPKPAAKSRVTYGSYSKRNLTAGVGTPFDLGFAQGSVHAYGEIDDSFSFYRGLHPSHQMLQAVQPSWRGRDWSLTADYMYVHANGEVQTPGWNRLTQTLIDSGTYITGRNTSLKDADGNGRLTLNELGGNPYTLRSQFHSRFIWRCRSAALAPMRPIRLDSGRRHDAD